MMSHEQADFPTVEDLSKELERSISGQPQSHRVLSRDGTMITLRGPSYSGANSLDVEIWILTVNGKRPSSSVLEPFLRGKVTIDQNVDGTR